jgi:hypothetical protein
LIVVAAVLVAAEAASSAVPRIVPPNNLRRIDPRRFVPLDVDPAGTLIAQCYRRARF